MSSQSGSSLADQQAGDGDEQEGIVLEIADDLAHGRIFFRRLGLRFVF
jgi:hypothetical protein